MKRSCLGQIALATALLISASACAQTGVNGSARRAASKGSAAMTVDDVVRLAKAGVSEEIILAQIRSKHQSFDLTVDQIVALKSAPVSDQVIREMMASPGPQPAPQSGSPQAASPQSTTAQSAQDQPAKTQPAKATSAAAEVALRSGSTPLRWASHDDPMGFSLKYPEGWEVREDRQLGRIVIQSPRGQKAVIWPMFLQNQQLDALSAGTVVQQLAGRVDATVPWGAAQPGGAAQPAGNAVRVLARGQIKGVAMMRWSSSPEGTSIYLACVIAPAPLYQASLDAFTGILSSFHFVAAPANSAAKADNAAAAAKTVPAVPVAWVQWNDPREGAFSASVPQGWNVSGGAFRQSATDIRKSLVVLSPDRQIRIAVGDAGIGAYTEPNRMYALGGLREGGSTSLGDGSRMQIRRFLTAQQFVHQYLASSVQRECSGLRVLAENDRPDLAASSTQQARAQGASNPRVTAAGISFSCTWNGTEARGYYATATILPFPGRSGIWYVEGLYGYLAGAERLQQADDTSRHILNSMGINAQWKQREDQIAGNAVQQDNQRSAEIQARARQAIADDQRKTSDMITKGYEARSKVYDEIDRKRENAILGTVDVIDPSSGKQYKIDNYSDYHWMNNQGVIAGTKTDTSPGADWRQMIDLP